MACENHLTALENQIPSRASPLPLRSVTARSATHPVTYIAVWLRLISPGSLPGLSSASNGQAWLSALRRARCRQGGGLSVAGRARPRSCSSVGNEIGKSDKCNRLGTPKVPRLFSPLHPLGAPGQRPLKWYDSGPGPPASPRNPLYQLYANA